MNITIELTEQQKERLSKLEKEYGISGQELARLIVEDAMAGPDEEFKRRADKIIDRNEELNERLAK